MARTTNHSQKYKRPKYTDAPVARATSLMQKVEELKLGKFAECDPLRLPEKGISRGWQIIGGVACALVAIIGIYTMLVTKILSIFDGMGAHASWYWLIMELMLLIIVISATTASVMLFLKKRVPVGVWYVLIGAIVIGLICASFHKLERYEARECYNNYPGIYPGENKGSGCPSVVNELSGVVLLNLLFHSLGIVGLYLIYRVTRRRKCYKGQH